MSQQHYTPPKVRQCAQELVQHHDTEATLAQLRTIYPNLTSYNTAVNRLRAFLVATEERHPNYEADVGTIESQLVEQYTKSLGEDGKGVGDSDVLACIRFLYEFKSVPLRRQLQLLKKISRGQMPLAQKDFENQLKNISLLPEYVSKVQLSNEESNKVKSSIQQAQLQRSSNVINVANPNSLIYKCKRILRNHNESWENVCVALALVTGRRTVEILLTGSFEPVGSSTKFLRFTGQVKTGLQNLATATTDSASSYVIPVLASSKTITQRIKDVQRQIKHDVGENVSNETVNHRYSFKLGKAVKELVHPNLRFHDLRTLYALISFEAFKPHTYGLNGWVSKVLGHAGLHISTHYTTMQIGPVNHIADIISEFTSGHK